MATWYPSPEQYAQMHAPLDQRPDNCQLAANYEVGEATIRRAISSNRKPRVAAPPPEPVAETPPGPTKFDLLKDENARLKAAARKDGKQSVLEHRIVAAIAEALERNPPQTPRYIVPAAPAQERETSHEMLLLASDWHAGEVVDSSQVSGINEFNWAVLQERVSAVVKGVLSFAAMTPNMHKLTIGWLGDMVNGIIHEEIVASNEMPVAEQCVMVGELMAQAVMELAPHIEHIHNAGVAGNHARTKAAHASVNVFDSWDWVAYHLARLRTMHLANVTWDLPKSGTCILPVGGKRLMLFHGDGIKSSMVGFPAGGVARRANELQAQFAARGEPIDMLACGHFHDPQLMGLGRVLVNGSLVGMNEYGAKNYGGGAKPCQLLATFDSDRARLTQVAYVQA